jgi:hypothetical protein
MSRLKLFGEQEGGAAGDHSALSNLGYAQSGHTGFVPSQGEALVDILRLTQNLIRDSGGNTRLQLATSAPHVTLAGRCKLTEESAIGGALPLTNKLLLVQPASPPSTNVFTALYGQPSVSLPYGSSGGSLIGLDFTLVAIGGGGGAVLPTMRGINVGLNLFNFAGTATDLTVAFLATPLIWFGTPAVSTWRGLHAPAVASNKITNAYGAHIEDITTNTGFTRLLEVGPSTPYLRLVGGGNPPTDKSNLYLKFGSTLYRVVKSGNYVALEAP